MLKVWQTRTADRIRHISQEVSKGSSPPYTKHLVLHTHTHTHTHTRTHACTRTRTCIHTHTTHTHTHHTQHTATLHYRHRLLSTAFVKWRSRRDNTLLRFNLLPSLPLSLSPSLPDMHAHHTNPSPLPPPHTHTVLINPDVPLNTTLAASSKNFGLLGQESVLLVSTVNDT